jgi:hypothetical protein
MNRYSPGARRARWATFALALLPACSSGDTEPQVGVARQSLTAATRICADYEPYSDLERVCEDTTDVGRVHSAARQRAGSKVGTTRIWVDWVAGEEHETDAAKVSGWFAQAERVVAYLKATNADVGLVTRSLAAMKTEKRSR